jgi:hypothetical protein
MVFVLADHYARFTPVHAPLFRHPHGVGGCRQRFVAFGKHFVALPADSRRRSVSNARNARQ